MAENTKIQWAAHRKRFEKHYVQGPDNECWPWLAARLKNGYGAFGKPGGGLITAHRVAYILSHGEISGNLVVDHVCRNRCCVNPAHLEAVTYQENALRGLKGRLPTCCGRGHEWNSESTRFAKNGRRFCLFCRRIRDKNRRDAEWWRAYREKRKNSG